MVDLFPTPATILAESAIKLVESTTKVADTLPIIGNVAILTDSACTAGHAGLNFYCSPNPVAKICFGASCVFGIGGAVSSGFSLATSFLGIPITGLVGSFGARGFNRLGKYTLHMENVTSAKITNVTEIAELMN